MTEPLYLEESDRRTFEATVERVLGDRVVLDRTLFYPEGGGQPHDTGTLSADGETWRVTDVRKKDAIYHALDGEPPAEGTRVRGELDWGRRYAHMRYHTAQHLLSALLLAEYDAPTTGNQIHADRARIDVGYDRFTDDDLEYVDARVNELVDTGMDVRWYEMEREDAEEKLDPERTRLDLLPDSITEVRIVEIRGAQSASDRSSARSPGGAVYDRTACAGTHVSNTREVGEFRLTGRETKGSDEERLTFELA